MTAPPGPSNGRRQSLHRGGDGKLRQKRRSGRIPWSDPSSLPRQSSPDIGAMLASRWEDHLAGREEGQSNEETADIRRPRWRPAAPQDVVEGPRRRRLTAATRGPGGSLAVWVSRDDRHVTRCDGGGSRDGATRRAYAWWQGHTTGRCRSWQGPPETLVPPGGDPASPGVPDRDNEAAYRAVRAVARRHSECARVI
jgi:hypothetical protein